MYKLENEHINVTLEHATYASWAFTIKKLGGKPGDIKLVDYTEILDIFGKKGIVKHCVDEKDPSGRLHLHGIVQLKKGFFRKSLCLQSYHVHLVEIYNEAPWLKYMNKEKDEPFINTQYAF